MPATTKPKSPKTTIRISKAPDGMAQLRAAANESNPHNISPFAQVFQRIDWSTRSVEEVVEGARLALGVGAHLLARDLVMTHASRFPDHSELQKMAHILAPPRVTVLDTPPDPSRKGNMAWLKNHWEAYRGKWVALRSGELLAVADSMNALLEQVGEVKNTNIMVTPIW